MMKNLFVGMVLLLAFASCKKETKDCPSSTEKTFAISGFTRISAGETFTVTVKQGTAYSIKAKGCSNELNDLLLANDNGTLTVRYNRYRSDRYRVDFEITLPTLSSIALDGVAKGTVSGFGQQANFMKVALSGTAKCNIDQLPPLVDVDLSGVSELTLNGTASDLIAHLSGDSKLNAHTASFNDADVYTSGTAVARLVVQQSLFAQASGNSRVYYKGNPTNVNAEQSGTAKVIHE
ncbi:MAG: DUF2807 domain-containing protein [Chitinophagaceae bacterium]|nr:MAG: DUF2807 domain-containing protein [Chitinophagaceae bacterium]